MPAASPTSRARTGRQRCVLRSAAAALLAVSLAAKVLATDADDLCAPEADPCVFNDAITTDPGSIIDLGGRALSLGGNAAFTTFGGDLTIRAGALTVTPGASIRTSGTTRVDAAGDLVIEVASALFSGDIDLRGSPAGDLSFEAATDLSIGGAIRGRAEAADESAAIIELRGGRVIVTGPIELIGGRDETGGDALIAGTDVLLFGLIDVTGGDGGTIEVVADQTIDVQPGAELMSNATLAAGDGGDITLDAGATVDLRGRIVTDGRTGGDEGGGDGGTVSLSADERLTIHASAVVQALGGSPDGIGGEVEGQSLFGEIQIDGPVLANSDHRDGLGGGIDFDADTVLTISSTLQTIGGLAGGGDIVVASGGDLLLAADTLVDASASRPATAGSIQLQAGNLLRSAAEVLANSAQADDGTGGSIDLNACEIDLEDGSRLETQGPSGSNLLNVQGTMDLAGTLLAGPERGTNVLRHPSAGPPPDLGGATIQPPPQIEPSDRIVPCRTFPPTATPTLTPSQQPTNTPTPTVDRPPCPGDCDGDGIVAISELIRGVNISLGTAELSICPAADSDGDGRVSISDLVRAVNASLDGCPA